MEETENLAYRGGEGSMEVRKWNAVNEWIGLYLAQPAQTQQTMNKMYLDKHLFFFLSSSLSAVFLQEVDNHGSL